MNKKITSKKISSEAGSTLRNPASSKIQKQFAASALSQRNPNNQTGKAMESKASRALKSSKYNDLTKRFAASILAQSDPNR